MKFEDKLLASLETELQRLAKEEMEPVIKKATADFEAALRARLGTAVLGLANHFSAERMSDNLVITVRNEYRPRDNPPA